MLTVVILSLTGTDLPCKGTFRSTVVPTCSARSQANRSKAWTACVGLQSRTSADLWSMLSAYLVTSQGHAMATQPLCKLAHNSALCTMLMSCKNRKQQAAVSLDNDLVIINNAIILTNDHSHASYVLTSKLRVPVQRPPALASGRSAEQGGERSAGSCRVHRSHHPSNRFDLATRESLTRSWCYYLCAKHAGHAETPCDGQVRA